MFTRTLAALLALVILLGAHVPAHAAARAYLVHCDSTSNPTTGRVMYVGEYRYSGQSFFYTFPTYCPYSVEVY